MLILAVVQFFLKVPYAVFIGLSSGHSQTDSTPSFPPIHDLFKGIGVAL